MTRGFMKKIKVWDLIRFVCVAIWVKMKKLVKGK